MKKPTTYRSQATLLLFILVCFITRGNAQQDAFLRLISTSVDFTSLSEKDVKYSNQFILHISVLSADPTAAYTLQMTIRGRGIDISSQAMSFPAINWNAAGQKTVLSSELAKYFDIDNINLSGITKEAYLESGLEAGAYTICFRLIDITPDRNRKASNDAYQTLFVRIQRPPTILFPSHEEELNGENNYIFSWTSNHISAQQTAYHVTIYEDVEDVSPEELSLYNRPVLQEKVIGSPYVYDANRRLLKNNKKYVVFVQAKSRFNNLRFINNGYSEGDLFSVDFEDEVFSRTVVNDRIHENMFRLTLNSAVNTIGAEFYSNGQWISVLFADETTIFRSSAYCTDISDPVQCDGALPGVVEFGEDLVEYLNQKFEPTMHYHLQQDGIGYLNYPHSTQSSPGVKFCHNLWYLELDTHFFNYTPLNLAFLKNEFFRSC